MFNNITNKTEIQESMEQFIQDAQVPYIAEYDITIGELRYIADVIKNQNDFFGALTLAFRYGQAKGYHMANTIKK